MEQTEQHIDTTDKPMVGVAPSIASGADPSIDSITPKPDQTPSQTLQPPTPKHHKHGLVVILAACLMVVLGGVLAWYLLAHKNSVSTSKAVAPKAAPSTKKVAPNADPLLAKFTSPTTGEKWLAAPQKVAENLGYVDPNAASDTVYYQVGTRGQNTIYLSQTIQAGAVLMLFEKAPDGTVRAILQPDAAATYNSDYEDGIKQSLPKTVVADTTTHYDSLTLPSSFDIGHGETAAASRSGYIELGQLFTAPVTGTTKTVVGTFGGNKLVKVEHVYADTKLTAISYAVDLPMGSEVGLAYKPIDTDMSTATWDNGVAVSIAKDAGTYTMGAIIRGCGSAYSSVSRADGATDGDFVAAGKTADGKVLYAFKDSNNTLVQKAYTEYKDYNAYDKTVVILSLDDFVKQHALIAYKNGAGEWLVYTRTSFAAVGGCAKPVVYLYPTHAQNVTVRVGAKVTVSDPLYDPTTGWTAFAQPSGQLTVNGHTYGSLFWEGQGSGTYPGIISGTVVKHADAVTTIKSQLRQQGLAANEINDFVAYWQPKIPDQPYVRLTWLNTAQMNELAPLHISPAPNTLIRVFLDMDGYSTPPKLPAQHLSAIPRQGFTVVEWGGLTQVGIK